MMLRNFWNRCVRGGDREIHLKAKHVRFASALIGAMFFFMVVTSHLNRESLKQERQARVGHDIASLRDRTLTKRQVASIAQAMIRLARPSDSERNRRNLQALMSCQQSRECTTKLTRLVERTLQIQIPVKGKTVVVRGKPGPRGPQGLPGPAGKDGANGRAGNPGSSGGVDSSIIDGVDNRVATLERALQDVVSHIGILDRLVAVLCRVLTPTRCG